MKRQKYKIIEEYMLSCMSESDIVHDRYHIYRVLYNALELSKDYKKVDKEVLIISSLLHDIGRHKQLIDSNIEHAIEGARMAYQYLISNGWDEEKARHVKDCISTHTYKKDNQPRSIEAKILFDADKLEVIGAIGIARIMVYNGMKSHPFYSVNDVGEVKSGDNDEEISFLKDYKDEQKNIYNRFYTVRAKEIAEKRKSVGTYFYDNLFEEVNNIHKKGIDNLYVELD